MAPNGTQGGVDIDETIISAALTAPPTNGTKPRPGDLSSLEQLAKEFSTGYRSVGAMVYDVLKDAILSGALAPGMKLRQESLAEAIGVSRLPVRSALIQLESDGLVLFHERRGAVVTTLSEKQVREIYELRTVLECFALREAIRTMTSDRLGTIRGLATEADAQSEGPAFIEARNRFYDALYNHDERPLLADVLDDLRLKVGGYLLGRRMDSAHGHSHGALVDVIERGDSDAAEKVLSRHLQAVCDGVVQLLEPSDAL